MSTRCWCLALLLALSACGDRGALTTDLPNQSTAEAPPASETPAPDLEVAAVALLAGERPESWTVLGLVENRTDSAVERMQVRVELLAAGGAPIAERLVSPVLASLGAGQASPFVAEFSRAPEASAVRASAEWRPARPSERAALTIELGQQFVTPEGELAVLGAITNLENRPAELLTLSLLALDPELRPRALAEMRFGPAWLDAGERVPFLAVARLNPGHVRWRSFHAAVPTAAQSEAAVELRDSPELRFTPQGAPFVIGEVQNSSSSPRAVGLLLMVWEGNRLVSMSQLHTPIPLDGGARLSFTATQFPGFGLRADPDSLDELRVEVRLESVISESAVLPLAVGVDAFHSVGSALLVRGRVTNEQATTLSNPAVLLEVRGLDGALWTAGWSVLPAPLEPGQQHEFVLELPLARELDLTSVELDLRAYGSKASD